MIASKALLLLLAGSTLTPAQSAYKPPSESAAEVLGVDFQSAQPLNELQARTAACDLHDSCEICDKRGHCDTQKLVEPFKCSSDPSSNTAVLMLKDSTIFFDAKMAIDADGSELSKKRGGTDLPETSWHFPTPPRASVDSEHIPYIVLPMEFVLPQYAKLRQGVAIRTGDVAAVVYKGKIAYALVADVGPACKIGEGSMKLHDELGHPACTRFGPDGLCTREANSGIPHDVLYFVFPGSAATLLADGITPVNANQLLQQEGEKLMQKLKTAPAQSNSSQ